MTSNYSNIIRNNIKSLYKNLPENFDQALLARQKGHEYFFKAFAKMCCISPEGIFLNEEKQKGVQGILISLYALYAKPIPCKLEPLKAFREIPDSMPYVGAFSIQTEKILVPKVHLIKSSRNKIAQQLDGHDAPEGIPGDFSIVVYPLPKIALCYIFYDADDDFDAGTTCLYANNAPLFMPVDGLADVGEYTSKTILEIILQDH